MCSLTICIYIYIYIPPDYIYIYIYIYVFPVSLCFVLVSFTLLCDDARFSHMLDIVATITTSILPFEGNHTFFNQLLHQVFLMSVLYGVGEGVKFFCLMSKFVFLFELLSCYIIVVNSLGHLCLVCVCVFTN